MSIFDDLRFSSPLPPVAHGGGFLSMRIAPPTAPLPAPSRLEALLADWETRQKATLMQQVRIEGPVFGSGCWIWTGTHDDEGYGIMGRERAHRVSYRLYRNTIADELVLDHLCERKPCVNPWHLEAVTSGENVRRRMNRLARFLSHGV